MKIKSSCPYNAKGMKTIFNRDLFIIYIVKFYFNLLTMYYIRMAT